MQTFPQVVPWWARAKSVTGVASLSVTLGLPSYEHCAVATWAAAHPPRGMYLGGGWGALYTSNQTQNRKQRVHPRRQAPQAPRAAPSWWGPRVSSCSWGLNQCLPSQGQNLRYRYNHLECFNRTLTINETRSIHTAKQSHPSPSLPSAHVVTLGSTAPLPAS